MSDGHGRKAAGSFVRVVAASLVLASCSSAFFGSQDETPPPPVPPVAAAPPPVPWPTNGWATSVPEAQGIDSDVLADALDTMRARHIPVHSLLIERHGVIVLDAYFYPFADNKLHDVASVTKSVVSTLVGVAQGENKIADVDAPVFSMLPDIPIQNDDARKARITLANLLSMTSGLDCSAAGGRNFLQQMEQSSHWASFALDRRETADPGSTFAYCAGNMHLVSAVLTHSTGASASEFAQRELFAPLGIEHVVWPTDADGVSHGFADLKLQPRDMAKLGYLWLHNGQWEGRQIVPQAYVRAAFSPHADVEPNVKYGYGMWIYPSHGHAGGPADFEANGNGGQRIAVIPSQDMVVVITGNGLDANEVAALIAAAPKSDAALPPNPAGSARLSMLVVDAALDSGSRVATQIPDAIPRPKPILTTLAAR